jgi:hypothetical protein
MFKLLQVVCFGMEVQTKSFVKVIDHGLWRHRRRPQPSRFATPTISLIDGAVVGEAPA